MASFAAQAAIRSKWGDLIDSASLEVPGPGDMQQGLRSVVGWLKQASLEVREAGKRAVGHLGTTMGVAGGGPSGSHTPENIFTIIHFNDVYNIDQSTAVEPVGGAARFCTAVKELAHLNPLVLFSGDAFSPSMLSTFTKGEQMIPVLNALGTHCAVFGNHDFDHGLEVLSQWVKQTEFPWLMSNVIDNETGRPLGDGRITHVVPWAGVCIGLVGLVEREWLDTLATINPSEVTFIDYVEAGNKLGRQLKDEGCDIVIALTHMRTHNDIILAERCNEIDLILGGHDHSYEVKQINNISIIKSGTDFRQFSKVTVEIQKPGKPKVIVEEVQVTSQYPPDLELQEKLRKYTDVIEEKMTEVLGSFSIELDGRFNVIRTQETNLGNWVCDILLAATGADLVLINSGTFRSDQVHKPGPFTMKDLVNIVPMRDPLIVIEVTADILKAALENSVSTYPRLEGRFLQVAGVSFAFDPSAPPGQRVEGTLVRVGDEYLSPGATYRLAIKHYMMNGCDGYTMFKNCPILVDEDSCPEIGLAIQNHFRAIDVRLGKSKHSKHRQSLVTLSRRHSLVKMLDNSTDMEGHPVRRISGAGCTNTHKNSPTAGSESLGSNPHRLMRRASLDDLEQQSCQLSPRTEHRIVIIQNQAHRMELLQLKDKMEASCVIREVDEGSP